MAEDSAPRFKVVFVGDSTVGKTSLINNYMKIPGRVSSTLGATSTPVTISVQGNPVVLNVWDTAGQENFRNLVPIYAKGAQAAVIVFDLTSIDSFKHVPDWYKYVREHVGDIFCVIAANKTDLPSRVNSNELLAWAEKERIQYFMTSAKDGSNVDSLFETVASELFKAYQQNQGQQKPAEQQGPKIKDQKTREKPQCCE